MMEAMIAGESDPAMLARLAHKRIKASPQTLIEALRGRINRHHRFLLRLHLIRLTSSTGCWPNSTGRSRLASSPFAPSFHC
jgi:hypothetical protein